MKNASLVLVLSIVMLAPACRKSEIDEKPAAQVSEPTATTPASDPSGPRTAGKVIREKSSIRFVAAKVTRDHQGEFKTFDGSIEYAGPTPVGVSFEIDLSSVETDTEKLTAHLKTADFFDVAKYPKATFTATSLTPDPDGTFRLHGTLDLHGVQKSVTIPVRTEQTAEGVHTTSEFTINRQDWGIAYKGMPDDLIKDEVLIRLDLWFPPPPAG